MQLAIVEGNVVSTIKHASLKGWRLLIVQPIDLAGRPDGDVLLAVDMLGAGVGGKVVISSDGKGTREMIGDATTPARWCVMGLVDDEAK